MRRILFTALMLIGLCLSASAQKEEMHYYSDSKGSSWVIREFIDRSAKMYYFDGDSEKDCTMEMKNYKKSGNTETFDIYYYMGYEKGKKRGSITIVTDPDGYRTADRRMYLPRPCGNAADERERGHDSSRQDFRFGNGYPELHSASRNLLPPGGTHRREGLPVPATRNGYGYQGAGHAERQATELSGAGSGIQHGTLPTLHL